MSIRKALGAVKDQATIGIARVSGAVKPDLDVAIVRATSHDDAPPDDRHAREVLRLAVGGAQRACVASLARRLARTRDYIVASKCLALLHRFDAEGDPHLRGELLRPATTGRRAGEPVLSLLLDFRDEAHAASWDHSAFVRAYALYLDERVRFLVSLLPPPRAVRFADDYNNVGGGGGASPPAPATTSVRNMDPERLLVRARQLRQLLDLFLACRPAGAARNSRVVIATLYPLLKESFQLYEDLSAVLAVLLDRFFDMEYPECVKAFETYVSTAKQIDNLLAFYAWCDDVGVARSSDFPEVKRVDEKLLETLEQFLRERGRDGLSSPPPLPAQSPHQTAADLQDEAAEYVDMNSVKALPAPEGYSAETSRSVPAKASAALAASKTDQARQGDLVDLREPAATADEQGNKLALALFSALPATNGTDSSWVAFPSESDDAPVVTSAWQTPAAEPGKAGWELALVETASNLSCQTATLGDGIEPLLLGGMYDQGAVRQQVAAQATSGSASSVALPTHTHTHGAATPVLRLPAPDGTVQTIGGDPFAASLAVPPPSYVQMAEMERKQQLLVQEQQMWAQYRQGGMQGQPVGFNGVAAGSAFASNTVVAMPYGMPMAYNYVYH